MCIRDRVAGGAKPGIARINTKPETGSASGAASGRAEANDPGEAESPVSPKDLSFGDRLRMFNKSI